MRDFDAQVRNLQALSRQNGDQPGMLDIRCAAEMLVMRDELIVDLKRVIEDDCRYRREDARAAR